MQMIFQFDGKTGTSVYHEQNGSYTDSTNLPLIEKIILKIKYGRILKMAKLKEFCHSV